MNQRLLLLAALANTASAFSPASLETRTRINQFRSDPLHVGYAPEIPQNDPYFSILEHARRCLDSDRCSLEETEECLDEVLQIQTECATGAVESEVCENVDVAAELVANLRARIASRKQLSAANSVIQLAGFSMAAVGVVLAAMSTANLSPDVTPFTMQEWWWAVRDGYLPEMISHYVKNGGLSVGSDFSSDYVPVTLQEVSWAVQNGFLSTLISQTFVNGGLASDFQPSTTPLTPQEWMWAMQDGYLGTMIDHVVRNGGLVDVDGSSASDVTSVAFTPQEWMNAMQGGYAKTMIEHLYRNGGL